MAKRRSPRSTERGESMGLRSLASFDDMAGQLVGFFAPRLGVKATEAAVRAALADPASLEARLGRTSAPALRLLEHILDMGGELSLSALLGVSQAWFGADADQTDLLTHELVDRGLVVPLLRFGDLYSYALLDLNAREIARRVRGLTLPEVKEPPAPGHDVGLRDRVALIASVAHVPMRYTQSHDVNRGSAKKLAAIVGMETGHVIQALDAAIVDRVLGATDKLLFPIVEPLRQLARGELVQKGIHEDGRRVAAWVGARWISAEAVARAVAAASIARRTGYDAFVGGGVGDLAYGARLVEQAPLARATVDGVTLVRAAAGSRSGHGDGHVTPSFEVMLGPAADPELVATVALATEPLRFDLVLTRRITPRSIQTALSLGVRASEILEALEAVGRHGVPGNVRAMVEDWSKSARLVRVSKVWALEASSAEVADAIVKTLGERVASRPSPTVILVSGDERDPTSEVASRGLGALTRPAPLAARVPAATMPAEPPASLTPSPAPALRERVTRALASGPVLPKRAPSASEPSAREPVRFMPWRALEELIDSLSDHEDVARVGGLTDVMMDLWGAAGTVFDKWNSREPADQIVAYLEAHPLELLPWLVLSPRDRRRLLDRASTLVELIALSKEMTRAPRTTDGMTAERLLRDPELQALLAPLRPSPPEAAGEAGEPMSAAQIRERFTEAATVGAAVTLRVRGPSGERTVTLIPERIHERGRDVALLGTDPKTETSLSFPLAQVLSLT